MSVKMPRLLTPVVLKKFACGLILFKVVLQTHPIRRKAALIFKTHNYTTLMEIRLWYNK